MIRCSYGVTSDSAKANIRGIGRIKHIFSTASPGAVVESSTRVWRFSLMQLLLGTESLEGYCHAIKPSGISQPGSRKRCNGSLGHNALGSRCYQANNQSHRFRCLHDL